MQEWIESMEERLYIGLMSGTSLDGVDAVLVQFHGLEGPLRVATKAHVHLPFTTSLQQAFRALNDAGENELHRAAMAGNALVRVYAQAVEALLQQSGIAKEAIRAIGAHGQTVRHQPGQCDGMGYTVQVNQPALLAELTGIAVVADFRSRDVAAGGQGAPLVPAFHQQIFASPHKNTAILNLGGIANLSLLLTNGRVLGLDTGPANALLDAWCREHTGRDFDESGAWAATGQVNEALLSALLQEPYFTHPGPKSTGLDLFNLTWLAEKLRGFEKESAVNVQATLAELTAVTVAHALRMAAQPVEVLGVCGGGVFNQHLMARLQVHLGRGVAVQSTQAWGVEPTQVEALAFAWLARQCILGLPGNVPAVTNAKGHRVLGAIYPA